MYELLLFIHISAAIIWIGSGGLLHIQAIRADRAKDDATFAKIVQDAGALGNVLFIPASLTVFVAGVILVIDGPWEWDMLWVILGLIGYFATFATGLLIIQPGAEKVTALVEEDGGMSPRAMYEAKRMLALARIDYITLYLVVAIMAIKPTGDDVATLVVMGLVLVGGAALIFSRARAIEPPPPAASAPA